MANVGQLFTLVVEPEKEQAVIAMVELYPPPDFEIDSFAPAPGWHRDWTIQSGKALLQKATWTREGEPQGEAREEAAQQDSVFQFVARPQSSKTYAFEVRATYSDGSVIHWRGADSVAFPPSPNGARIAPAPTLVATSGLGRGGGGSSPLALVALVVGALGLLVGVVVLLASRGVVRLGARPD
jgi:hypothetical protein